MRCSFFWSFVVCFLISLNGLSQTDHVGSGRALRFDVGNYIEFGDIYDDLALPFTISAWVKIDPNAGACPIFVSQDNAPLYNGFWFYISHINITLEYGDGRGENLPAFRRGKIVSIPDQSGRWTHVAGVMTSANQVDLYVNGINVGGSLTGASTLPMASQYPNDVARTGHQVSNGVSYWFKGSIDDIQVYNKALTVQEIRERMTKKLSGTEDGLIGYWTFDELSGNTVFDKSPSQHHGELKSQGSAQKPKRVFSGAPIGDENVVMYTGSWAAKSLTLGGLSISDVTGDPGGAHIYRINDIPSQTGGLAVEDILLPYYGVFLADFDPNNSFDMLLSETCQHRHRADNSEADWYESTVTDLLHRREIIPYAGGGTFEIDLGEDLVLCQASPQVLSVGDGNSDDRSYHWNTGATTPSITVNTSGQYIVEVAGACGTVKDTINVDFLTQPTPFSLGDDKVLCDVQSLMLHVFFPDDVQLTWTDGSTTNSYAVTESGKYYLTAHNECGSFTDSISISLLRTPPPFSLGEDEFWCENAVKTLTAPEPSEEFAFEWQDGSANAALTVSAPGLYWLRIGNACGSYADSVKYTEFSFDPSLVPNVITPNGDTHNERFIASQNEAYESGLRVFNRWGKLVYESIPYHNEWQGTDLGAGVYYYVLSTPCRDDFKGTLYILK